MASTTNPEEQKSSATKKRRSTRRASSPAAAKPEARTKRSTKKAKPEVQWSIEIPEVAKVKAAEIKLEDLEPKTRVHQLARDLEITSKQLITLLGDLGMKKVVMSSLTKDEVAQATGAISGAEPTAAKPTAAKLAAEVASKDAAPKKAKEAAPRKRRATREAAAPADSDIDADDAVMTAADVAEASDDGSVMDEVVVKEGTQKRATRKRRATRSTAEPAAETKAAPEEKPKKKSKKKAAEPATTEPTEAEPKEKPKKKSKGKKAAEDPKTEKIRQRVEKNVANEIHQIEEKVERELAEKVEEAPATSDTTTTPETPETPATSATPETPEPLFRSPIFLPPTPAAEADAEVLEIIGVSPEELTAAATDTQAADTHDTPDEDTDTHEDTDPTAKRRRRGRRGGGRGRGTIAADYEDSQASGSHANTTHANGSHASEDTEDSLPDEPVALRGSTRLEAQRRRRNEMREEGRKKRHVVSQAEFLARRESVERTMVVRERQRSEGPGTVTEVGVLEDEMLVEHFVTSDAQASMIGNIYLGRVQNVLPSMEAAFIDIGKGRNGVLYAGEVDWRAHGLGGRQRRIEQALKSGDQVLVQVSKDPVGHKGARLTTQISLAGRYLVYVPGGRSAGISRKLPGPERKRLKEVLKKVVPDDGGAIIRTAAEGVAEEAIAADVNRLHSLWQEIEQRTAKEKKSRGNKPVTMYEEPNLLVKVVRDLFNEDFSRLVVDGERPWNTVHAYVQSVAPDLLERLERFDRSEHEGKDAFAVHRIDEQIQKALSRKVWLPSGGTLVIDRTEAMTVIDVNTGKFTGSGGNLEETVTRNNLEAAEEIVRQMRLRDLGGMIVVDFIDMVLPENQDLVLRRLTEALGRDRTRHQVSEVTSLGLVQMTRKRLGTGLMETFSTPCEHCDGTGYQVHADPVEPKEEPEHRSKGRKPSRTEKPAETPKDTQAEPSIEELVNAVVVEEDTQAQRSIEEISAEAIAIAAQEDPDEPSAADYLPLIEEPSPSRQRRNRRAARKSEKSPRPVESEIKKQAEVLAQAAPAEEPQTLTYEEALAAFEASPRRKRRTRGNSRSDHRPRKEDFVDATASDVPDDGFEPVEIDKEQASRERRSRRGTRRGGTQEAAVSHTASDTREQQAEAKTRTKRAIRRSLRKQPEPVAPEEHPAAAPVEEKKIVKLKARGRRRAVRRIRTATTPAPAVTPEEPKEADVQVVQSRRGRRRVVRRSTGR